MHNPKDLSNAQSLRLEAAINSVLSLSLDERVELVGRLLGQAQPVQGVRSRKSGPVVQLEACDRESLGDVLDAIATRLQDNQE